MLDGEMARTVECLSAEWNEVRRYMRKILRFVNMRVRHARAMENIFGSDANRMTSPPFRGLSLGLKPKTAWERRRICLGGFYDIKEAGTRKS